MQSHIFYIYAYIYWRGKEWRRPAGCLRLQVIFRKRANNYRALLQVMTSEDKASYGSLPPCKHILTPSHTSRYALKIHAFWWFMCSIFLVFPIMSPLTCKIRHPTRFGLLVDKLLQDTATSCAESCVSSTTCTHTHTPHTQTCNISYRTWVKSENSFREIASFSEWLSEHAFTETLTQCTWKRRRASYWRVQRGKCRSMQMRVLETLAQRTSSPHVDITAYIQPRRELRDQTAHSKDFVV